MMTLADWGNWGFDEPVGEFGWGAEFMNPWHDEIGRFAPKGTGTYHAKGHIPGIGDVGKYLADNPRLPGEALFVWQGRLIEGLPLASRHALLFEIRERYEPVDYIADGIKRWRQEKGLPEPQVDISEIPANQAKSYTVARVFEEMPDQSGDPRVQAAFEEFKRQNNEMWEFMTKPESEGGLGITVEFWTNKDPSQFGVGPYEDAAAQAEDLRRNRHIFIEADLGGEHGATMTQEEYDQFRAVHDVFGHAGIGGGFDRHGEYQAYLLHSSMYTGDARRAMASEYHGVNSAMWSGMPGSPGTGKSVLLPEELIEDPWDETGALRPVPTPKELAKYLPEEIHEDDERHGGSGNYAMVSAQEPSMLQLLEVNVSEETAAALAELAEAAGMEHLFAQQYDPTPYHHVVAIDPGGAPVPADDEMAVYQWGVSPNVLYIPETIEFANPWHDEQGRFAPKGTGKQSTGAPAPEPVAAPAPADTGENMLSRVQSSGGRQTPGLDADALATQVENGGSITIDAIDADDVIKAMADAPQDVVDLTGVTIEGSPNMFSQMRGKGPPRDQMPQITPDVQDDWFNTLRQEGIGFGAKDVDPATLSATQSELNGKKVGGMIQSMQNGTMSLEGDALLVSSDGHILDGHHRWAAAAAISADCGGCIKIPVIVMDMTMDKLLTYGLAWTDSRGIPRAGVGAPSKVVKKQAATIAHWAVTMDDVSEVTNLYEGVEPIPEGQSVRFITDAEDGITDADLEGLPAGDGSAFNTGTAPAEPTA